MMKHKGSSSDISAECARQLMKSYRQAVKDAYETSPKPLRSGELIRRAIDTPTERFYVSDMRAYQVVAAVKRGQLTLDSMTPQRKEMYEEIIRRADSEQYRHPERPLFDIVAEIVELPAPKFYLTLGSAKVILHKERRRQ